MTYVPHPTVTVGGVDYTGATINQVRITTGRTSIDTQPRAGYAQISLLITDLTYPALELNSLLKVAVDDSAGTPTTIFTGYISDVNRSIRQHGRKGTVVYVDITAVGPLARLTRYPTNATYPKAKDGDRIHTILESTLAASWNELSASVPWDEVPATATWDTYDPSLVGSISTPGTYELQAWEGGITDGLSLCGQAASSALGVLYETAHGLINYDDITTRVSRPINNGYTELSANYINAIGTSSATSVGSLINKLSVNYKNGQTVEDEDPTSETIYGLYAASRSTSLEYKADAEAQLALFLGTRSRERATLSQISVPLHNPQLPNTVRDALIGAYCGMPLSVTDMPRPIYPYRFQGFIEGWTWTVTRKTLEITANVSDYALSAITQAWQQVLATERWDTLTATLTWQEATVVA